MSYFFIKDNKSSGKNPAFAEKASDYICPMLLGSAICFSVVYAMYEQMAVLYTALFFILEYFIFRFFDRLQDRGKTGGAIYILILIVVTIVSSRITAVGAAAEGNALAPMMWFFGAEGYVDSPRPIFMSALFIGGGFFIISVLYYFTQVRYRTLGVMLTILFPFAIYARRSNVMPEIMTTFIIVFFLAVIVHNRRIDPASSRLKQTFLKIDRSYIITLALFVSITGTIAMLVKKPVYISQMERRSINSFRSDFGVGIGNGDDLSALSSKRYGNRDYNGEILFRFETEGIGDVYYLRRQPYERFNGDVWQVDQTSFRSNIFYNSFYSEYTRDMLLSDFQEVIAEAGIDTLDRPSAELRTVNGRLRSDSFAPLYLPCPLDSYNYVSAGEEIRYRKYQFGSVIRYNSSKVNHSKELDDRFQFFESDSTVYSYAAELGLNDELYEELLTSVYSDAAERLLYDYDAAITVYSDESGISDEIADLADHIAGGYQSDFAKAYALESYFRENGFIYDEEYIPEDQSIEFFLFESKTGVCSSYATAMTLMARSQGLAARYVEGFAAFEKDSDGRFLIRDRHAHAFVEVYIPGAGWLTFDPTVPDYRTIDTNQSIDILTSLKRIFNKSLVLIIVGLLVVIALLYDRIREILFRVTLFFLTPKHRVLRLYENLLERVSQYSEDDKASYTVKQFIEYISFHSDYVPEYLTELFEKTAFGNYNPSDEEFRNAYSDYKRCFKFYKFIFHA